MKLKLFSGILLSAILLAACSSTSKTPSPEAQAKAQKVTQQINNKQYTIEVNQAQPMRGRSVSLSYGYDLKISNDSAYAYLPYYGVAQSAPYGGGEGGIKFSTLMKGYAATPSKDGWEIKFKVDTPDYNYEFFVNVFSNGSSSINVTTYQRDPINFLGSLKGIE